MFAFCRASGEALTAESWSVAVHKTAANGRNGSMLRSRFIAPSELEPADIAARRQEIRQSGSRYVAMLGSVSSQLARFRRARMAKPPIASNATSNAARPVGDAAGAAAADGMQEPSSLHIAFAT
jgi:hypothetical protein